MYLVYYGDQFIHDVYSDDRKVHNGKLSGDVNTYLQLEFTVPPTNPMVKSLKKRDYANPIIATFNEQQLFRGYIEDTQEQINTEVKVTCKGDLAMLADTVVRPYTTSADDTDQGKTYIGGSGFETLFRWFINQHNSNCLYRGSDGQTHGYEKQFTIKYPSGSGTSLAQECSILDNRGDNYRSSTSKPTTLSEIQDKILDSLGAYLQLWYDGDTKCLALYADIPDVLKSNQTIEFGVNMTDYTFEDSCLDTYTAIRPEGGNDDNGNTVNIASITDGVKSTNYYKRGDVIYHMANAELYGYREYAWSNSDITSSDNLLANAIVQLQTMMTSTQSIDVSAMDMVFTNDEYIHLLPGYAAVVQSSVHGINVELAVSSCNIDFDSPGNTSYSMGASASRITKSYSEIIKDIEVSNETATGAQGSANQANQNAIAAQQAAQQAQQKANNATDVSVSTQQTQNGIILMARSSDDFIEPSDGFHIVYASMASTGSIRQLYAIITADSLVESETEIAHLSEKPAVKTVLSSADGYIDTDGYIVMDDTQSLHLEIYAMFIVKKGE